MRATHDADGRSAPHIVFVAPDPCGVVSGGHLYNARICDGLRTAGARVDAVGLDAVAAAGEAHAAAVFVFDSLYLAPGRAATLAAALPAVRHSYLLAHHVHSLYPEDGRTSERVFAEDEQALLARFSGVWATSSFTADYLAGRGVDPSRIFSVEPGTGLLAGSDEVGTPPRLLLVANLIVRKGILDLLAALAVRAALPDFALRIVGGDLEPDYARRCRGLVAARPQLAARVDFAGPIDAGRMGEEYRRADLLVSAAQMETFGMAIREAITAGVPVLLLDAGFGRRHLEVGGAGVACAGLEELVASLIELATDRARLAALKREAAARRPPLRTWDDAAREVLAALASRP